MHEHDQQTYIHTHSRASITCILCGYCFQIQKLQINKLWLTLVRVLVIKIRNWFVLMFDHFDWRVFIARQNASNIAFEFEIKMKEKKNQRNRTSLYLKSINKLNSHRKKIFHFYLIHKKVITSDLIVQNTEHNTEYTTYVHAPCTHTQTLTSSRRENGP